MQPNTAIMQSCPVILPESCNRATKDLWGSWALKQGCEMGIFVFHNPARVSIAFSNRNVLIRYLILAYGYIIFIFILIFHYFLLCFSLFFLYFFIIIIIFYYFFRYMVRLVDKCVDRYILYR